jgi:hypothetical protein
VAVTFGFTAYQPYGQAGHDWRRAGIAFDTSRRTLLPGRGKHYSAGRARFSLADRLTGSPNRQTSPGLCAGDEHVILGLARGRNERLTGLVDVAHESARAWLCGMAEHAIDCGADAIDIRAGSHAETLDWENYGFSEPALAEFRRRHGTDVSSQPFDRRAWQTLQGEYFDTFMAEMARVVHGRGAKLFAHVMPVMEGSVDWPEGMAFHNQQWNWRRWVSDGWVDGLTLKGCRIGQELFAEAMALCRRYGRETLLNNKPSGPDRDTGWMDIIDRAQAEGVDMLNLYESANLVRLQNDGRLEFSCDRLWHHVAGAWGGAPAEGVGS